MGGIRIEDLGIPKEEEKIPIPEKRAGGGVSIPALTPIPILGTEEKSI
jgi:hypothetical protein